jgi:transcriptional regulator with PAS, ATPase and Fis domain
MHKEMNYMTDILNKKGLKEGDTIVLKPFGMKTRNIQLRHNSYEFCTKGGVSSNWIKKLDSVQGETFHYKLAKTNFIGPNKVQYERYKLQSICGTAFKLNGSFVTEAFLEVGDICEIGYHKFEIKRKQVLENELELFSQKFLENEKLIKSNLPILIEGETGVGKTTLAKDIHDLSGVAGKFVHINLSAYSKNLLESELFGHVKGAFTGALTDKKGALKQSNGGTLFIDEIDSLPIEIQTKLLLFLDSKKVTAVGGEIGIEVRTRIICAAGKKLSQLVEKGSMRKDFYFRIASGANVLIPPLRDNTEIIKRFIQIYSVEKSISVPDKLIEFYQSLPWPGNIRQIKGHLEKKYILMNGRKMCFDELDNELMSLSSALFDIEKQKSSTMKELKNNYAKKIYFECNGNLTHASKILGISVRSLRTFVDAECA